MKSDRQSWLDCQKIVVVAAVAVVAAAVVVAAVDLSIDHDHA